MQPTETALAVRDAPNDFKYSVALSFLAQDEALAQELNDLIQERMATFLYSERQRELAGTDGEETFGRVFKEQARIVVVLYRDGWGQTPWTRIEETAIRGRAYDEGYDFVLFIPCDEPPTVPKWLPKTRIWFGLKRWGPQGAAAVIEARVQEFGGGVRQESVADRAARLKRATDFENERRQFRRSHEGVRAANDAYAALRLALTQQAQAISVLPIKVQEHREYTIVRGLKGIALVELHTFYGNSLEDEHYLSVSMLDSLPRIQGLMSMTRSDEARTLAFEKYHFDLLSPGRTGWRSQKQQGRDFDNADDFAGHILRLYMDHSERIRDQ